MAKRDVRTVAKLLWEQYGRSLSHIGTSTEIAEGFVGAVEEGGRLGDAAPVDDDWTPSLDDVDDFAGAGVGGMVRLWRAQEVAHYALIGLARAGRLLPRPTEDPPDVWVGLRQRTEETQWNG